MKDKWHKASQTAKQARCMEKSQGTGIERDYAYAFNGWRPERCMEKSQGTGIERGLTANEDWVFCPDAWKNPKERELKVLA